MPQYHLDRILLATDFSPGSRAALPYAVAFARRFGSKLYLAHVIPADSFNPAPLTERNAMLRNIHAKAKQQMDVVEALPLLNRIPYETLIDHGDTWRTLSAIMKQRSIDLLVVGTNGRRGLEKLLLGSTAEEILRMASNPVLMVGPDCSIVPQGEFTLHRILHDTDFAPESKSAYGYAHWLAKEFEASLALLHVADDIWQEPLSTRLRPVDFFRERLVERHWSVKQEGVATEYYVDFGPRADRILEMAARLRSELIVMGVRGSLFPEIVSHLPGPAAYDVVSRASCPVLIIRGEMQLQNKLATSPPSG